MWPMQMHPKRFFYVEGGMLQPPGWLAWQRFTQHAGGGLRSVATHHAEHAVVGMVVDCPLKVQQRVAAASRMMMNGAQAKQGMLQKASPQTPFSVMA